MTIRIRIDCSEFNRLFALGQIVDDLSALQEAALVASNQATLLGGSLATLPQAGLIPITSVQFNNPELFGFNVESERTFSFNGGRYHWGNGGWVSGAVSAGNEDYVGKRFDALSVSLPERSAADRIASDADSAAFLQKATVGGGTLAEIQSLTTLGSKRAWILAEFNKAFSRRFMDRCFALGSTDFTAFNQQANTDITICTHLFSESAALRAKCLHSLTKLFVINFPGGAFTDAGMWVLWLSWYDRLDKFVFGNWLDLIESVTYSLHMSRMLTYFGNEKETATNQPDENYAREIMQLFSIGLHELNKDGTYKLDAKGDRIPTYNNSDIRQVARSITGLTTWLFSQTFERYDLDDATSRNRASAPLETTAGITLFGDPDIRLRHYLPYYEYGSKKALGGRIDIPAGTDPVTNLKMLHEALFYHPNTPPFFAKRMIQHLVTSNPTPAYVARVAAAFEDNGAGVRGDLKSVWMAILTDPEAADDGRFNPGFGRVKDGFDVYAGITRPFLRRNSAGTYSLGRFNSPTFHNNAFGATAPRFSPSIFGSYDPLHIPGEFSSRGTKSSPVGSPELQQWSDVQIAMAMSECMNTIGLGERGDANGANGQISDYSMLPLTGTPAELVERLNLLMCGGKMSAGLRSSSIAAISSMPTSTATEQDNRVAVAMQFVANSPDFFVQL